MDIAERIEQVFHIELTYYQKCYARAIYEALANNESVVYIPARGPVRFDLRILHALIIALVMQGKDIK